MSDTEVADVVSIVEGSRGNHADAAGLVAADRVRKTLATEKTAR